MCPKSSVYGRGSRSRGRVHGRGWSLNSSSAGLDPTGIMGLANSTGDVRRRERASGERCCGEALQDLEAMERAVRGLSVSATTRKGDHAHDLRAQPRT